MKRRYKNFSKRMHQTSNDELLEMLTPAGHRLNCLDELRGVRSIIADGCDRARDVARETLEDVRQAMGLSYG